MDSLPNIFHLDNGIVLEIAFSGDLYHGLSRVSLGDRPFVVRGRGHGPHFVTPDGIAYNDFKVSNWEASGQEVILDCEAVGRIAPIRQDFDLFHFPRISAHKAGIVSDTIRISIKARTMVVEGEIWNGFEISYEFRSDARKIHWVYESLGLAPGGSVAGARVIAQNMSARRCPLEAVLERNSFYSTEETYDNLCIQSPPRGGGAQFFDLAQGKDLAAVSFFEPAAARSLLLKGCLEKNPGEDFVTVSDFHYGSLSSAFSTAPRVVLAAPRKEDSREDALNRWTAWFDYTGELWRREFGIRRTVSVPTLTFEGTGQGGIDVGTAYPGLLTEWEKRLDWVVRQGFQAINLHTPEWIGAANQTVKVFGGNNCCPWEFRLSGLLGWEKGLRVFCDACHARGVKVFVWISGHLHRESPLWEEHPEWIIRAPNQSLWDGNYGVIHSFSFAHGAGDWQLDALKEVREKTGIDGVWLDSFAGLVLHPVNWQSSDLCPNAPGVLRFLGALSNAGFEIMIEGLSQLGVSSWGNLRPSEISRHEEVMLNTSLRYFIQRDWRGDPAITRDFYFRLLAAQAPAGVWLEEFFDKPEPFPVDLPEWFGPLTRAYNHVASRMQTRLLVPGGAVWRDADNKPAVCFAFEDISAPDLGVRWREVSGIEASLKEVKFAKGRIYESF